MDARTKLEIVVDVDNLASQKNAEKVGALREGLLRNRVKCRGAFRDAYIYSLVATVSVKPDANPTAAESSTSAIGN